MKLVIPLAGYGTRMRPHTYVRPKPLINVAGKPVLAHILDRFQGFDIEEAIFIVGYMGDQIAAYVDTHYRFPITRYVEQTELKGQAHALWLAREYLSGPLFIIFVDTIADGNLDVVRDTDADGIAFVKEVEDPRRFGIAMTDASGKIVRFVEKPDTTEHRLALIGLYWLREGRQLVEAIEELLARDIQTKGEYYLADALQLMIDHGAVFRPQEVEVWKDCGTIEATLDTNQYLLAHGSANDAHVRPPRGLVLSPSYIGQNVVIEGAVVGPYATVLDGAVIRDAVVRDAIVGEGATIEKALVEHSIIGPKARVRGRFQRLNVADTSWVELE
ncbi:MAG: NTP transferase domain-containing protein [Chloroflexi bacterium]|nr:NTP transferase domain-containing protein [Chloroflexota bacterium]